MQKLIEKLPAKALFYLAVAAAPALGLVYLTAICALAGVTARACSWMVAGF